MTSVLAAQVGLPAAPSAIDVVSKPDGQLNVLVSSEGSDTIYVFAQVAGSEESGGGAIVTNPHGAGLNAFEPPTLSAASQSFTLAAGTVVTSAIGHRGGHDGLGLDELKLGVGEHDDVRRIVARQFLVAGQQELRRHRRHGAGSGRGQHLSERADPRLRGRE